MASFEEYLLRHGECWMEEMLEEIGSVQGIRTDWEFSLEARWNSIMAGEAMKTEFCSEAC